MTHQETLWAKVVQDIMRHHKWNHRQLGEQVGAARQTVQCWDSGTRSEPAGWLAVRLYLLWAEIPRKRVKR